MCAVLPADLALLARQTKFNVFLLKNVGSDEDGCWHYCSLSSKVARRREMPRKCGFAPHLLLYHDYFDIKFHAKFMVIYLRGETVSWLLSRGCHYCRWMSFSRSRPRWEYQGVGIGSVDDELEEMTEAAIFSYIAAFAF